MHSKGNLLWGREDVMENTIRIMDLDVDIISMDTFVSKMKEYLTDDYLNLILLMNTRILGEAEDTGVYRELVSRADLILPGEDTLLSLHHGDVLEAEGMVVNYKCLFPVFRLMEEEKESVYFVTSDQQKSQQFHEFCKERYPHISVMGSYIMKSGQNDELIVNEINSLAPSLLVLSLENLLQEKWILENYTKLNAKICIGVGDVLEYLLGVEDKKPSILKKLGLEHLFCDGKNLKLKKIRETRIFKKKIAHYKNKKGN